MCGCDAVLCHLLSFSLLLCLYSRIILFNYMARTGKQCGLTAAMAISIAWNCFASAHSLEQPINVLIFNKMLADELKQPVIRYDAMDYKYYIIWTICYKSCNHTLLELTGQYVGLAYIVLVCILHITVPPMHHTEPSPAWYVFSHSSFCHIDLSILKLLMCTDSDLPVIKFSGMVLTFECFW